MLAGMLLIPPAYFFQATSEAAAAPTSLNAALLLTSLPMTPVFDQIHKLERPVIATYIVKGQRGSLVDLQTLSRGSIYRAQQQRSGCLRIFQWHGIEDSQSKRHALRRRQTGESLHTISQGYARGKTLGAVYEREILEANDYPSPDLKDPDASLSRRARTFSSAGL